eukprot:14422847-Alexandrium_andersonii.AAC.1
MGAYVLTDQGDRRTTGAYFLTDQGDRFSRGRRAPRPPSEQRGSRAPEIAARGIERVREFHLSPRAQQRPARPPRRTLDGARGGGGGGQ